MAINYDRALEEEKIMNQVYPSPEILAANEGNSAEDISANKQAVLNTEIFEIGKVSRCMSCASEETFDDIEAADQFRRNTVRTFAFFGTIVFVKTITEFLLRKFYMNDNINENAVLIFPALDIFETLLTIYTLYCMFMLCSCLQ